jgi:hypothetical protein
LEVCLDKRCKFKNREVVPEISVEADTLATGVSLCSQVNPTQEIS